MHCRWDWGRTDLELGICVSGIVAWLGSRWDGIKAFSSVFWHFISSILIPLLNSVHYSAGDMFTALLLYLTLQGLSSFEFWWYWVIFLQGYEAIVKRLLSTWKKKSSVFLKGRSLFELPVLCVFCGGGTIKKKKQYVAVYHSFHFLKKDKTAYTSLRKNSQLFTPNNYLEISGYHMRIVGFFFK